MFRRGERATMGMWKWIASILKVNDYDDGNSWGLNEWMYDNLFQRISLPLKNNLVESLTHWYKKSSLNCQYRYPKLCLIMLPRLHNNNFSRWNAITEINKVPKKKFIHYIETIWDWENERKIKLCDNICQQIWIDIAWQRINWSK